MSLDESQLAMINTLTGGKEMTFTVNPEKKREWDKLWWRDCPQGRVLLYVSLVSMVLLVVALVHLFLTVDFELAMADPWTPGLDSEAASNAVGDLIIHILVVSLFFVLSCLVIAALRIRRDCLGVVTDEKLLIEDGVLTYSFHDGADAAKTSRWVVRARLEGCRWRWDPKRREVVVTAVEEGALREKRLGRPSKTLPAFGEMEPTDELRFDPVFDPDPVEYLRSIGAPEEGARG